jgi:hypothetical protein
VNRKSKEGFARSAREPERKAYSFRAELEQVGRETQELLLSNEGRQAAAAKTSQVRQR